MSTSTQRVDAPLLDVLIASADADGITEHVVGAVIGDDQGRALLLHRPAGDFLAGLWEVPSGGVEDGEDLIEALAREVFEETGLKVTSVDGYLDHFDYTSGSGKATRQFTFTVTTTGSEIALTEHDDYQWADAAANVKVSSEVAELLHLWRQQLAA